MAHENDDPIQQIVSGWEKNQAIFFPPLPDERGLMESLLDHDEDGRVTDRLWEIVSESNQFACAQYLVLVWLKARMNKTEITEEEIPEPIFRDSRKITVLSGPAGFAQKYRIKDFVQVIQRWFKQ